MLENWFRPLLRAARLSFLRDVLLLRDNLFESRGHCTSKQIEPHASSRTGVCDCKLAACGAVPSNAA